jgi:alkyldihydroxyacetonephosphate synthase
MVDDMPFAGWGDPARRHGLPAHAMAWLEKILGVTAADTASPSPPSPPPPSRLTDDALVALRALAEVRTDDEARVIRAGGKSYLDLLRAREGDTTHAPDAVVLPDDEAEVAAVLNACVEHRVAVVPFGGGTSVVGGVDPVALTAVVSLDLRRMDALLHVDETALTATFQPGVRGPAAEALLRPYGLHLGHLPQSFEQATIGGFVATRSAGQASTGHGRIDDMVVALTLVTPAGTLRLGRGAKSAAGPDLRALVVGSEGAFGVITEVTLRVRRIPSESRYEGYLVRGFDAGRELLRTLEQDGLAPDVARLSDPHETAVQLTLSGGGVKGALTKAYVRARAGRDACLLILGWEDRVAARRAMAKPALSQAISIGQGAGQTWLHGRYDGPYLRDDLMDAGVLVETLETSASWSDLDRVHADVRAALTRSLGRCVVMCHVSHLYPQGASLYFTVLAKAVDADQWRRAKVAASDAIVAAGATITHHHAVGADHVPWMGDEVSDLGLALLRAVKATLDPDGICNPGTLLP